MFPSCQMVNMQPQFSRQYYCLGRNGCTFYIYFGYFLSLWILNEIWSQQNGAPIVNWLPWVLRFPPAHVLCVYSHLGDIFPCYYTGCYWGSLSCACAKIRSGPDDLYQPKRRNCSLWNLHDYSCAYPPGARRWWGWDILNVCVEVIQLHLNWPFFVSFFYFSSFFHYYC